MIRALVVDCGRPLLKDAYTSSVDVLIDVRKAEEVYELDSYELVVLPSTLTGNQSKILEKKIVEYLSKNGVVFCFSSHCIDCLPSNHWDRSVDIPSIHYALYDDTYNFFKDVDVSILNRISDHGWKSEGFIKSENEVQVVVCSYEELPVMIVDEISTSGTMVITAGLGILERAVEDVSDQLLRQELHKLWQNMINLVLQRNLS